MVLFHLSEELWTGKDSLKNKVVSAYRLFKVSAQTATISYNIYEKIAKTSANSLQNLVLCTRVETKDEKAWESGNAGKVKSVDDLKFSSFFPWAY